MADANCNTRLCSQCRLTLPFSSFNKDKTSGDGIRYNCRSCQKANRRNWYLRNQEREIVKSAQWAKDNPEKAREKDRKRNAANPGRTSVQAKAWWAAHPETARELSRAWKKANPEKLREQRRRAYARDPEKFLARSHKRRLPDPTSGAVFTRRDVTRIYAAQKGKCACCRTLLGQKFERDHITSLAQGGTNDPSNIQLLCLPCNRSKSDKHPIDFMQEQGFLL